MTDDFEYFSMIGRGGNPMSANTSPERDTTAAEMSGSSESPARHHRTMSAKGKEPVARVRSHGRPNSIERLAADDMRPRTNSMPSNNKNLLRVRNFQTSSRGLENQGDTLKSSSHCSLASTNSSEGLAQSDVEDATATTVVQSNTHRILLLGGEGVGKTALTQQFLTSDDVSSDDILGKSIYQSVSRAFMTYQTIL